MTRWNVGRMRYAPKMTGAPPGDITLEDTFQLPGYSKRIMRVASNGQVFRTVWVIKDGKGWQKSGDEEATEIVNDTTKRERPPLGDFVNLSDLQDSNTTLTVMGEEDVNGRPAVVVKCESKGGEAVTYFDKETALLVRVRKFGPHPVTGKEMDLEAYLTDYKEVQGGQVPMRIIAYGEGKPLFDVTILDIEFLDRIDPKAFAKP